MEYFLSTDDVLLLKRTSICETAEPVFEYLKFCLVWVDDELPVGLSSAGKDKIIDLLIARNFIYHLPAIGESPFLLPGDKLQNWIEKWDFALAQNFEWAGFKRTRLNESNKAYFLREYERAVQEEDV